MLSWYTPAPFVFTFTSGEAGYRKGFLWHRMHLSL